MDVYILCHFMCITKSTVSCTSWSFINLYRFSTQWYLPIKSRSGVPIFSRRYFSLSLSLSLSLFLSLSFSFFLFLFFSWSLFFCIDCSCKKVEARSRGKLNSDTDFPLGSRVLHLDNRLRDVVLPGDLIARKWERSSDICIALERMAVRISILELLRGRFRFEVTGTVSRNPHSRSR